MKRFFKGVIVCAAWLFAFWAQGQGLRHNPKLQERLTQVKLTEIQRHLGLSEEKMQALRPIYKAYDREVNALHWARQDMMAGKSLQGLSSEEADKLISDQLDNAIKMSTIRKAYYTEFKTVLTPQQIIALFKSEAQMRRRVMMEVRRRAGNLHNR